MTPCPDAPHQAEMTAPVVPPGRPEDMRHAPAAARNRAPIRHVLAGALPASGTVLEVACGTGEHATALAAMLPPGRTWRPTDADPHSARAAAARVAAAGVPALEPVRLFDVHSHPWPPRITADVTAIVAINLIHISPWSATLALMAGAGATLPPGGLLYLYGPYRINGAHTAPSNAAFDDMLRTQNPAWGVRDLDAVTAEAARHGLGLETTVAMPANNLSVIFRSSCAGRRKD